MKQFCEAWDTLEGLMSMFPKPHSWKHNPVRKTLPQLEFMKCASFVQTTQFKKTPA